MLYTLHWSHADNICPLKEFFIATIHWPYVNFTTLFHHDNNDLIMFHKLLPFISNILHWIDILYIWEPLTGICKHITAFVFYFISELAIQVSIISMFPNSGIYRLERAYAMLSPSSMCLPWIWTFHLQIKISNILSNWRRADSVITRFPHRH